MKQKNIIILALFCALAFIGGGILWADLKHKPEAQTASGRSFAAGTEVQYTIFSGNGQSLSNKTILSDNEEIKISNEKMAQLSKGPVTYDISVKPVSGSAPVTLRLKFDEKTGSITMDGRGLQKFSDIALTHPSGIITAKADWAGKFRQTGLFDFKKQRTGRTETFQIAFQGQDLTIGTNFVNPHIVKILFAPGGGRPPDHTWDEPVGGILTPNPENNIYPHRNFEGIMYFETWCGDSPALELSVCNNAAMTEQIVDVVENYVTALIKMTEQLSAVMMQYVQIIGSFLDAKTQLETEREIQTLVAEAHKDYHPSEEMCMLGTFVRSLADTEERMKYNKLAFNKAMMTAYTGTEDRVTSEGYAVDIESRTEQFRKTYCNPADNNNGLRYMCQADGSNKKIEPGEKTGGKPDRYNKDINYVDTVDIPLTLDIDFTNNELTNTEEDVFALARNLYWPRAIEGGTPQELTEHYTNYMGWRNLAAINNVAHNSFAQILAMKSESDSDNPDDKGGHYMKFLLKEMGMSAEEADKFLGENPSYYAQMEVLTKKIYQDPDFYTNLYDKPQNVRRINISLEAIKLMQGRDRFESSLRREMLVALLVENAIAKHVEATNALIKSETKNLR